MRRSASIGDLSRIQRQRQILDLFEIDVALARHPHARAVLPRVAGIGQHVGVGGVREIHFMASVQLSCGSPMRTIGLAGVLDAPDEHAARDGDRGDDHATARRACRDPAATSASSHAR